MKRIAVAELHAGMTEALTRRGLSEAHTRFVVDGLIETSLRGVDTHGVRLFPVYLQELDGGRATACPEFRWYRSKGAAARLDADGALGVVAGRVATDQAIDDARQHGIAVVSVNNSNHFAAASVYTLTMARAGLVGMAFSNSDALVAAHGGARRLFGTNPLSFAVPADGSGPPFCVDMATSQSSYSRLKARRRAGEPIAPGLAVTADGHDASELPTGDDREVALLPLGGHKGQCLAMMIELLCAGLAGTPLDHTLSHLYDPPFDTPRQVAHLFIAIDPSAFALGRSVAQTASELAAVVGSSGPPDAGSPGAGPPDGPKVPGYIEAVCASGRERDGIPVEPALLEALWPDGRS